MPDEIEACGAYLERQIAEIKPALIVTLGRHSMMQFFGPTARITQVHATLRPWRDIMAYACFHPAAALHQPKYREMLEQDFDGLPKALETARKRAAERAQQPPRAAGMASGAADTDEDGDGPSQLSLF
jgi:DNA polymerase